MIKKMSIFEDFKCVFIEETTITRKYVEILLPNNLGSDNWDSLLIFLLMVGSIAVLLIARKMGGHGDDNDPAIIALRKSEKKKKKLQEEKEKEREAADNKELEEGSIEITYLEKWKDTLT
jgi:hypothetical protein